MKRTGSLSVKPRGNYYHHKYVIRFYTEEGNIILQKIGDYFINIQNNLGRTKSILIRTRKSLCYYIL